MFVRTTQYTFFCHYLKCWLICTRAAVFGKFLLWSRCLYQYVCTYHTVNNFLPLSKMLDRMYYGSRIREIFICYFMNIFSIPIIFHTYLWFRMFVRSIFKRFPEFRRKWLWKFLSHIKLIYWSKLTVHTEAALKISLYVCIWCKNNTQKISHSNS